MVTREESRRLAERLQRAVQRPELHGLAQNPLLLTVMALVHTHRGRLPDARALLYEETVDILLWRWEAVKVAAGLEATEATTTLRRLLQDAGLADVDLKRILWQLAFTVHSQGGTEAGAESEGLADIDEFTLQKALAALHPDRDRNWAYAIIRAMKLRAGLLVERTPERYTFPHRTFQEYLAGAHLAASARFAQNATALAAEEAFWRQVILLAVGRLVYLLGDTDKPLALVGELCPQRGPTGEQDWRNTWLAGEVLHEVGLHRVRDSALGRDLLSRVQHRLVDLLHTGALTPVERAAAGDVLAELGDPRFHDEKSWCLPAERLLGFIEIPAGSFLMGRDPDLEKNVEVWEQPQHEVALAGYYIARYPVTVAQFQIFCRNSGYTPEYSKSLYGPPTRPVSYVTWREVLSYCEWLTKTLRSWAETPDPLATLLRHGHNGGPPWRITLPSEAEWERAARGTDGRIYPWGNEPNLNAVNCAESGLNTTSPVGCFPMGIHPHTGVVDTMGNLWELTRSLWGEDVGRASYGYPYEVNDGRENIEASNRMLRVLRGGAYYSEGAVGCGARGRHYPLEWYYGFRVVRHETAKEN